MGANEVGDVDKTEVPVAVGNRGNSNNRYDRPERRAGRGQGQWDFQYNRGAWSR